MDAASWSDPQARQCGVPTHCPRCVAVRSAGLFFTAGSFPGNEERRVATADFIKALRSAFEAENRAHPRESIEGALTSAICQARANWLLRDEANSAVFPATPDWTILVGHGPEIPQPTQGKTLTVLEVEDLLASACATQRQRANFRTRDLPIRRKRAAIASQAASRGIDRIVPLGRMHVFGPPWDGVDLDPYYGSHGSAFASGGW